MNSVLNQVGPGNSLQDRFPDAKRTVRGQESAWRNRWNPWLPIWIFLVGWTVLLGTVPNLLAASSIRFDMFLGYDNVLPQYGWYPVTFEIQNDGPGFVGDVEVLRETYASAPNRRYRVELPTGTLKRLQVPVFSGSPQMRDIRAQLLNSKGEVLAEAMRPVRARSPWSGTLIATLTRKPTVVPAFPAIPSGGLRDHPQVARLIPDWVPDNPLLWESLQTFYLSTESAVELKSPQVEALVSWIQDGGHLVVNVVHRGDLEGIPWLTRLLPTLPVTTLEAKAGDPIHHYSLFNWPEWPPNPNVQNETQEDALHPSQLRPEPDFTSATFSLYEFKPGTYKKPLFFQEHPLLASKALGRGTVTLLAFNAEQEPFLSWAHRRWFWATLAGCRDQVLRAGNLYAYRTTDNLTGLLIDTTQIRKLPVGWLMAILVAYLLVIGPFDRLLLKRMKREILTWITFPTYVLIFSGLIYWIGYYLRSGDTEWNELQIVDVPASRLTTKTRVHCFGSIYSPAHRTFSFQNTAVPAGFRFEVRGAYGYGSDPGEPGVVHQMGPGFQADIPVPIWTGRLYAQDTWSTNSLPISIRAVVRNGNPVWAIDNQLGIPLSHGIFTLQGNLYRTPEIPKGKSELKLDALTSIGELGSRLKAQADGLVPMLDRRGNAFGSDFDTGRPTLEEMALVLSFSRLLNNEPPSNHSDARFVSLPGLDMNQDINRGDAVLLAWAEEYHAIPTMNAFQPLRKKDHTLFRLTVPGIDATSP